MEFLSRSVLVRKEGVCSSPHMLIVGEQCDSSSMKLSSITPHVHAYVHMPTSTRTDTGHKNNHSRPVSHEDRGVGPLMHAFTRNGSVTDRSARNGGETCIVAHSMPLVHH